MSNLAIGTEVINEATVSLIEPIIIPDLFLRSTELQPAYSFMNSADGYANYYRIFERSRKERNSQEPVLINYGGNQQRDLLPLNRKHSLHSYWRYFRRPAESAERRGRPQAENDRFFLLPLRILMYLNPITVNNQTFSSRATAYLFPFGSCVLKLEIKFSAISLADFINIIPNLKRAIINRPSVDQDGTKNFSKFAQDFVSELTRDLFGNQRIILPFDIHTSIFVRKMSPPNYLQILSDPHKRAIAAAMTGRSYDDMLSIKDVSEFFPAELDTYRSREILLFHPKGSFFYASPDWQKSTPEIGPEVSAKLRRKAECMRNNYVSFLVVLFAVNRFLKECPPSQHPEISNEKLDTIKNCFRKSFLTNPSEIYFKHAFQKIAPIIGLDKSLNEL